jgi:hypothetical protein
MCLFAVQELEHRCAVLGAARILRQRDAVARTVQLTVDLSITA